VATGVLVVSLLLWPAASDRRPLAATAAGMLVGTVWAMCMVVSADLDAVDRPRVRADWDSGIGSGWCWPPASPPRSDSRC